MKSKSTCSWFLPLLTVWLGIGADATAQCSTTLRSMLGVPGTSGTVVASTMWDPDGPGPQPPLLVVGGSMTVAGTVTVNYVATYDRATRRWSALGNPGGNIHALAVLPNGDLIAAGTGSQVVRWDGSTWVTIGNSNGAVRALTVLQNGDLVAGGEFTLIGGIAASNIARWNGSSWSGFGSGITGGDFFHRGVHSLAVTASGDLCAGGNFDHAGGVVANDIARWNGAAWSALGTGMDGAVNAEYVRTLLPLPNGDILAGGSFGIAGGVAVSNVARWNGVAWSSMGSLGQQVYALRRLPSGIVHAFGSFGGSVSTWSGTMWVSAGLLGSATVLTATLLPSGEIALGGTGNPPFFGVVLWDGSAFTAPSGGITVGPQGTTWLTTATTLPSGDVVVGGSFGGIGGVTSPCAIRWDGTTWHALGLGLNGIAYASAVLHNGDVIMAGDFTSAGGVAASRIARWDGTTWTPLGTGMNNTVYALLVLPNGDLVAGGTFTTAGGTMASRVARWNGTTWSPLGGGINGLVQTMALLPGGDIVVGGHIPGPSGALSTMVRRWTGTTWVSIGELTSPLDPAWVSYLITLRNGDLVASGLFHTAGGVPVQNLARWNGTSWANHGTPGFEPGPLLELPDGDLLSGSSGNSLLWRRDGGTWSPIAVGATTGLRALTMSGTGAVVAAGLESPIGSAGSGWLRILQSDCPAMVTPHGTGCVGTLAHTTLPWVDGTFRARGTALPTAALVVAATSFTSFAPGTVPLQSVLPQALPGCEMLVAPDILQVYATMNGGVEVALSLPNTPPLVGLTFFQQLVSFELNAFGDITTVTATNALELTAGLF